ncbi:hypothetical protein HNV08_05375 [Winogradskyella eckloniae]|uniref:hypothetical protein n=1 Tax=Winogradskyella eckloniae TaxID=1089306 RepID=UPI0015638632|nr:hypothetical protein [Winogradskyella eckloniae]NRD19470.1 hypothetical protein [Winogradskyella eckloniae]
MKSQFTILLVLLISIYSCQRAKNKGKEIIKTSKNEISNVSKKAWEKSINYAFNSLSYAENISLIDIYSEEDLPEMDKINGVRINCPPNFYTCFFKYKSNKTEILEFLSNLNTKPNDIFDKEPIQTDEYYMHKSLEFIEEQLPNFKNNISFFNDLKAIKSIEYYRCNKFPYENYLAIDIDNEIIYHIIKNYWD